MNSPFSSPTRSRHRKHGLLALVGTFAAAALVATPLTAAQASIDDATPVADAGRGSNTEIVTTGIDEGLRTTGYLPPTAIVPDPATPYPDGPPADYTSRSGFIGIITTKSVDDPSSTREMYCIAARTPTAVDIGYQSGTWSEANVPNIGYVTYLLNNYFPAVDAPAELTPDQQAAATQAAIWYFTDGLVLGAESPVVRAATAAMIADAQANGPVTEPAAEVAINPAFVSAPAKSVAGPYVVTVEGAEAVTVSVPDDYTMYSDSAATTPIANGSSVPSETSIWITGPGVPGVETVLTARATVTVQRGSIYLYDGNTPSYSEAQPLVLADTTQREAVATATTEFFELNPGALNVVKVINGTGAGQQSAISLSVICENGLAETFDIAAGAAAGEYARTFGDLPAGTECTVAERESGDNSSVSVVADDPVTVTIAPGAATEARLTNTVEPVKAVPGGAVSMSGGDALAKTGGDAPTPLLALAAGVIGLGVLLMAAVRAKRRRAE
ncbi:DUF5979 domain-containing protein [Microbacterium sp. zg-YB36]|uniref:DUF5979 domain-containing protein n=1 Tax=Microbacterium sp. zg-YB36 TaxID=2969407 RepID=UPI00214BE86F|nr:DUF5979 domain-containing protein [Microbacterium sp. zg-YB36]MDL5351219.1 DUF5979 domain-containing protein [Microbacterium sp. zg-YB36]